MRLSSRAEYKARDEKMMDMVESGEPLEAIAEELGFKNIQVVRVKICKIRRKQREQEAFAS